MGRPGGPRRISTSNACVECRRRKIRCDGLKPCGQCQWYQHPEACAYSKPTQRVIPSRKLVDKLQNQVDQYHAILSRLYPGKDFETLVSLPREELINLAVTSPTPATPPSSNGDAMPQSMHDSSESHGSMSGHSLDALAELPEQEAAFDDDERRHKVKLQGISDDVNGLSLSMDRQSSYVGVSSINAALKVIFKTAPVARPFVAQTYIETALPSRANTPPPQQHQHHQLSRENDLAYTPPPDIGHKLIDAYFAHIHVLMPMVDEDQFWHTWLYGERRDSAWLALLNMVLALGSLASGTAESEDHISYFKRARSHLDLETFGSANLLVLQALGLLSGYYLHWLNRPNEANCLMGATLRMATALGLHREYNEGHSQAPGTISGKDGTTEIPADIRRRTWWSLFCLDAWGSTTTGRPSLGRTGPGISVQSPRVPQQLNNAQYMASLKLLPIIHNITFCKLATRIQDTLAVQTMLRFNELFSLDAELVKWHDDLPPILRAVADENSMQRSGSNSYSKRMRTPSSATSSMQNPFDFAQPPERDAINCPDFLKTPRAIMHWRYQNLRMLMHRPTLLATTLRRAPYSSLTAEEKVAVARCRLIAGQSIADIDATCAQELIAGWNAVWMMFQAVMVPLVSLFARLSATSMYDSPANNDSTTAPTGNDEDEDKWRAQIEQAMAFFDRMRPWSVAAKKSKDVVERLYEASKHINDYNTQLQRTQTFSQAGFSPASQVTSLDSSISRSFASPGLTISMPPQMHFDNTPTPLGNHPGLNGNNGMWGLSPNGEAAMNCFWDDMMWDTFPSTTLQDDSMAGPPMGEFDWNLLGGQGNDPNQPAWGYWPQGGQEQGMSACG
ncbi:hypothetical protein LTR95_017946 [Oleoguttula sp. CCFEE 5521]